MLQIHIGVAVDIFIVIPVVFGGTTLTGKDGGTEEIFFFNFALIALS